jgi:hypothetical protein
MSEERANCLDATGSVQVGDKVMILGGLSKLRGMIGTVSCRKADPDYVNVYVPEMGKYILHVGDLLKQNDQVQRSSDEQPNNVE